MVNNEAAGRFEIALGGQTAFAEYRLLSDGILFPHTVVPRAFEGQGIASRLARAALAYARERGLKVMPDCSFFVDYIRNTRNSTTWCIRTIARPCVSGRARPNEKLERPTLRGGRLRHLMLAAGLLLAACAPKSGPPADPASLAAGRPQARPALCGFLQDLPRLGRLRRANCP